jgi:fructuronate reductase
MDRLSLRTLAAVPAGARPPLDPAAVEIGAVHLGIGAFHRAHQAVYTQAAMAASGDLGWGSCGVTQRSATVADQLGPQDCLYSVLERGTGPARPQVNAAIRQVLPGAADRSRVLDLLARPEIRLISLTVTEKGYRHEPATGRLRLADPEIRADLASARRAAPVTVIGQLARAVQRRMDSHATGITVLCCDNLPRNGAVLRGLVLEFVHALPVAEQGDLTGWIERHARFPDTMVDRIVPATTATDLDEAALLLGVRDEGVVVAEPFSQWVIEDDFAAGRPAWELAGATLTSDVSPYEAMKLRLLNGTHSALAYLGALAGCEYLSEVVAIDAFGEYARALMDLDTVPTLAIPAGFDVQQYQQRLLERFANPALRHRTRQIAMDGSQKLPQRLLGTVRDRLAAGDTPHRAILAVAAWMRYVWAGASDAGRPLALDDPLAARLGSALAGAGDPAAAVAALLGLPEVFGVDLRDDRQLRRSLVEALTDLTAHGAVAAAASLGYHQAT